MSKTIYLSPSNHGKNQNKCLRAGCYEDKHTRPIAEVCAEYLRKSGFKVLIGKESQNMATRCREADNSNVDLYVPIHTNASSSPSARYVMFMCYNTGAVYRKIFDAIAPYMQAIYPGNVKAQLVKRTDLYEINAPRAKTIYCELGFHTNQQDCDNFIHNPEAVGKALAQGICQYFGAAFDGGGKSPSSPKYEKGEKISLNSCPLYGTSATDKIATHVTGTYYLWDGKLLRGRYRITNLPSRVGVAGQVTGWINKSDI